MTVAAIKSVNSTYSVGGPATCQSAWIEETLNFTRQNNVPLDFVSTHLYPTDFGEPVDRDVMKKTLTKVRNTVGPNTPIFYTEYNSGLYCCLHDTPFASAFLVSQIPHLYGIVDIFSYWTFTDIFEEWPFKSLPFQVSLMT